MRIMKRNRSRLLVSLLFVFSFVLSASCTVKQGDSGFDSFSAAGSFEIRGREVGVMWKNIDRRVSLLVLDEWKSQGGLMLTTMDRENPFILSVPNKGDYEPPPNSVVYYDGSDFHVLARDRYFPRRNIDRFREVAEELLPDEKEDNGRQ